MVDKLRVLLVDNQEYIRESLKGLLEPDMDVQTAASGEDAVQLTKSWLPQVVVMDIVMGAGQMTGIEAANKMRQSFPAVGIVLLSMHDDREYITEFLKDGAEGKAYMLKANLDRVSQLTDTIRAVARGECLLDPRIAERMVAAIPSNSILMSLTPRERQVLGLLAQGYSNGGIANELVITRGVVERHLNTIFSKLEIDSKDPSYNPRVQAVLMFLKGV